MTRQTNSPLIRLRFPRGSFDRSVAGVRTLNLTESKFADLLRGHRDFLIGFPVHMSRRIPSCSRPSTISPRRPSNGRALISRPIPIPKRPLQPPCSHPPFSETCPPTGRGRFSDILTRALTPNSAAPANMPARWLRTEGEFGSNCTANPGFFDVAGDPPPDNDQTTVPRARNRTFRRHFTRRF